MATSRKVVFWDVDTQADFMLAGGKLYVPAAEEIIPNLKRLADAARAGRVFLVSSTDAHTLEDAEFQQWPPHCLRGTPGQLKIPETLTPEFYVIANCPEAPVPRNLTEKYRHVILEKQALDVFTNPNTERLLAVLGKQPEYVVFGVVTEYCVWHTAKGLLDRGHRVSLVRDAIQTIKVDDGKRVVDELTSRGARLITTDAALALLQ